MKSEENTAQVMGTPEVTNKINLNLNQDDLIDLVIEDQIEALEKKLEDIDKKVIEYDEYMLRMYDAFMDSIIAKVKKTKDYMNFAKAASANGLKLNGRVERYDWFSNYGHCGVAFKKMSYKCCNLQYAEDRKNPVSYYKQDFYDLQHIVNYNTYKTFTIC